MQRQNINTVLCVVFIVLAVAVVAITRLRNDATSSNSILLTGSSSTGSAIQPFKNSSLLEHDIPISYPWTLSEDSSNKSGNTNEGETISHHDGLISDFISITDIARGRYITYIIQSTRSNKKCADSDKSLMRFTLITDNYPVRFVCINLCFVHRSMICVLFAKHSTHDIFIRNN